MGAHRHQWFTNVASSTSWKPSDRADREVRRLGLWIDPVSGWASVVRPASRQARLVRTGYEGGVDGVSSEKQVQ